MGRIRVPSPDIDRLPLSDGDWIEVKRDLNNGDQKRLAQVGVVPALINGRVVQQVNWGEYEIGKALIYITDWNIKGLDDKVLTVNDASLRAIDVETFDEINDAILRHITARVQAKKSLREAKMGETPTPPNATNPPSDPTST